MLKLVPYATFYDFLYLWCRVFFLCRGVWASSPSLSFHSLLIYFLFSILTLCACMILLPVHRDDETVHLVTSSTINY